MFAASKVPTQRSILATSAAAGVFGVALLAGGFGQSLEAQDRVTKPAAGLDNKKVLTAREILGPAAVVPLAEQPPAKIFIDPPLADQLELGRAVIQYRTENLRVMPVFGTEALAVSPRIGHLHVTVDDAPWVTGVWHGTNGGELILGGLPPGPHKVRIELERSSGRCSGVPAVVEVVLALGRGEGVEQTADGRPQPVHRPLGRRP